VSLSPRFLTLAFLALGLAVPASRALAQVLPPSGDVGLTFVYASTPSGTSQLYLVDPTQSVVPQPFGAAVGSVPSRWAHRRRTLGALETEIGYARPLVLMTPMGNAVGNGAIHFVDGRTGVPPVSTLVPTGNPAGYDLAIIPGHKYVFSAEDTGSGTTLLRGWSYATVGQLLPLNPPTLLVSGPPAAYVNRIGFDAATDSLQVPTASGVTVVSLSATAPQMASAHFFGSPLGAPVTNPASFAQGGVTTWIVGTCSFSGVTPVAAGVFTWTSTAAGSSGLFGSVPSAPSKSWVPASGAEELAVVSNGTDAYVYSLLREPGPGTFFVKGAAVGVVRLVGAAAPVLSTIAVSDEGGEPFSNPVVSGTRVAFETSFGPPFVLTPDDGGERICVIYSPLDPLGGANPNGSLAIPAPLGGRISTKGMDRPVWSRDGSRLFAATSWFPGAPQVGVPGLESLSVPPLTKLNGFVGPHTVVPTPDANDQSILLPTQFLPRDPGLGAFFDGTSIFGGVANDGAGAFLATSFGEFGQKQLATPAFEQSPLIPNFRAILPAAFEDVTGSLTPVPGNFGARRTSFNFYPEFGVLGLVMYAAVEGGVLLQPTGHEMLAGLGVLPHLGTALLPLPAGTTTTTEFLSL